MRRLSLIGVLVLAVGMVVACGGGSKRPHNAKCLACNQEFTIPEHHGIGMWTVEYSCPNCRERLPAGVLYKHKRGD